MLSRRTPSPLMLSPLTRNRPMVSQPTLPLDMLNPQNMARSMASTVVPTKPAR
jgi:hypothetical protein